MIKKIRDVRKYPFYRMDGDMADAIQWLQDTHAELKAEFPDADAIRIDLSSEFEYDYGEEYIESNIEITITRDETPEEAAERVKQEKAKAAEQRERDLKLIEELQARIAKNSE